MIPNAHSLHSTRREKILENLFIGELLRILWCRGIYEAELLQSDIDAAGYDLVLSVPDGMRHIQLKAAISKKSFPMTVNAKIADKQNGCVIVMQVNKDNLCFESFYWFGGALNVGCSDIRSGIAAKHTKANKDGVKLKRRDSFKLGLSRFDCVTSFDEIVDLLIGTSS